MRKIGMEEEFSPIWTGRLENIPLENILNVGREEVVG